MIEIIKKKKPSKFWTQSGFLSCKLFVNSGKPGYQSGSAWLSIK